MDSLAPYECCTLRLPREDLQKISHIASRQNLSRNRQVERILQEYIREFERLNGPISP